MRRAACSLLAAALGTAVTASTSFSAAPGRSWLSWNTARRTASLELVAGYNGANNGFNFDGYGRGPLLVRVPLGCESS